MAEHFRDEFDEFVVPPSGGGWDKDHLKAELQTYATEAEVLRGANALPTLSSRLRDRVLTAATAAYRQARRWAQARQAASFLSVCLLTSFVLSPLANSSLTESAWKQIAEVSAASRDLASTDHFTTSQQPESAWTLRHDRTFLGLPPAVGSAHADHSHSEITRQRQAGACPTELVANAESSQPSDTLLTALNTSDGWATVQAFQAVRSRSHSTLQRAFAAN